jgi:preprotein translocase subunit YajC
MLLALAPPSSGQEANPMASFVLMGLIFAIFYFVLILPMRRKQRKLEDLVKALKVGDRIVLNAGIFGTVEGVEGDTLLVRIADKTRVKVLKSAVAGLQAGPDTENK